MFKYIRASQNSEKWIPIEVRAFTGGKMKFNKDDSASVVIVDIDDSGRDGSILLTDATGRKSNLDRTDIVYVPE